MKKNYSAALAAMVILSSLDNLPAHKPSRNLRVMIPPRNAEEAIRKAEEKREMRKQKRLIQAQKVNK